MSTSDSPFACGEILSSSLAKQSEAPEFVSFLSQGVAVGALLMLPTPIWGLLTVDPFYGLLFIPALPEYLLVGGAFGIIEAIIIWACTYIARHRLNVAWRIGIAVVTLTGLIALVRFVYWEPSPYARPVTQTTYLIYSGWYVLAGLSFGLLIGSRFKPLNELARGVSPGRWPVITAITGFVLRFAVVLFLLYSILIFIWNLRANSTRKEFVFAVIGLSYFIAAVIIIFVRMPFWLLLPLAVIVNFPVAASISDVIPPDDVTSRTVVLSYLVLWAAFLSCRVQLPFVRFSREKAHKAQNENNLKGDKASE